MLHANPTATMPMPHRSSRNQDHVASHPVMKTPSISQPQFSFVQRLFGHSLPAATRVDSSSDAATVLPVNLRHLRTKLSRLNLTEAAREAAALKAQFRREDEELYRQGRGAEVLADRMKNLGMTESGRAEVLTVNGVRIKP